MLQATPCSAKQMFPRGNFRAERRSGPALDDSSWLLPLGILRRGHWGVWGSNMCKRSDTSIGAGPPSLVQVPSCRSRQSAALLAGPVAPSPRDAALSVGKFAECRLASPTRASWRRIRHHIVSRAEAGAIRDTSYNCGGAKFPRGNTVSDRFDRSGFLSAQGSFQSRFFTPTLQTASIATLPGAQSYTVRHYL
jgi:hypothetical protein